MRTKQHIRINHEMADAISVQDSPYHMCRPGVSSEIAFFLNGEFVVEPIEPFADYHDGGHYDTAVYGWVPNKLIENFLEVYRA